MIQTKALEHLMNLEIYIPYAGTAGMLLKVLSFELYCIVTKCLSIAITNHLHILFKMYLWYPVSQVQ